MKTRTSEEKIDFVITWVDGNDPVWRASKQSYQSDRSKEDAGEYRFRDWETLRYLFRGIETYASWVNKVYLVTCGQVPEWLNEACGKVKVVSHEEFMDAAMLPTFNSNAIEMNLHNIPGLSEQFVYLNDDFLLVSPVEKRDFFVDGKPKDMLALQPVVANPKNPVMSNILLNCSVVLSRHFQKWNNMRKQPGAYFHLGYPVMYFVYNALERVFPLFTGFYTVHGPSPLLKSTYQKIWSLEEETLRATSERKFRSSDDVTQYLFREWQKLEGNFCPANILKDFGYFELTNDNADLYNTLRKHKKKMICINDPGETDTDFDAVKEELRQVLEEVFPNKSCFEKE